MNNIDEMLLENYKGFEIWLCWDNTPEGYKINLEYIVMNKHEPLLFKSLSECKKSIDNLYNALSDGEKKRIIKNQKLKECLSMMRDITRYEFKTKKKAIENFCEENGLYFNIAYYPKQHITVVKIENEKFTF